MMNRGTGFIALTLAGHVPARVGPRKPPGLAAPNLAG